MNFKIWLENIQSLDGIYDEILKIIQQNDFNSAANLLKQKFNINIQNNKVDGKNIADQFYQILSGKINNEPITAPPNFDADFQNTIQQLKSLPHLKHSVDASNPWNNFTVIFKENKMRKISNQKMQFKIQPNKLSQIIDIAKIITDDKYRNLFSQFKFSVEPQSFLARRDNFVIYLSVDGAENYNTVQQLFQNYNYEKNQDFHFIDQHGYRHQRSFTDTKALDLAHEITKKHPAYNSNNLRSVGFTQTGDVQYLMSKKLTPTSTQNTPNKFYVFDPIFFQDICNQEGSECEEKIHPMKAGNVVIRNELNPTQKQNILNKIQQAIKAGKAKKM